MIHTIGLSGTWTLYEEGQEVPLRATVPGCVHTDLLKAGRIGDPFYRDHERRLQWIGERGWIYRRDFHLPPAFLEKDAVLLCCDGLDTLATIRINGQPLAHTDNMYRRWRFDAAPLLHPGANDIEVYFRSVLPHLQERQRQRALPEWRGPLEPAGRAWVRKQPSNFGWDWGPVLITCGIWRDIYLAACETARLDDVRIRQDHTPEDRVDLTIDVAAESFTNEPLRCVCTITHGGAVVAQEVTRFAERTRLALSLERPKRWWPNGLGDQPLYTVRIDLTDDAGRALDTWQRRIGLRTLHLERTPDAWGESFRFVVNGVPFFAKGANWIPADAFVTRPTADQYRALLSSAVAANMNMLRVWGGGLYEQCVFYDVCDELGLCVWQDFMFACSAYPTFDDAFMENVRAEVEDNVRRLRHHACLALWCGNNEIEQGLAGDAWSDRHMSWADYDRLFNGLLPERLRDLDPDRSYWPGSPHTPQGNRADFNDPDSGDAHLWDVWHGRKPFEWYRTCTHRFCSEFGFQSFPEPKTVATYTLPQDRNVASYVMERHQRSGAGNALILHYLLDWFRLPHDFEKTLWLSQILQGLAIQHAVEHWRRSRPRGMGTLYWQLNDCWPVASWSSIDYYGRWKALHYLARRFYAPLLVSGVEDLRAGTVDLHVANDLTTACAGTVQWRLTDLDGQALAAGAVPADVPEQASSLVHTLPLQPIVQQRGVRGVLLWLALHVDETAVSENVVLFARPKHLELTPPLPKPTVTPEADGGLLVTLAVQKPALWLWLELEGQDARFSDNFFHLRPGVEKQIRVRPAQPLGTEAFRARLRVCSLVDTYA